MANRSTPFEASAASAVIPESVRTPVTNGADTQVEVPEAPQHFSATALTVSTTSTFLPPQSKTLEKSSFNRACPSWV